MNNPSRPIADSYWVDTSLLPAGSMGSGRLLAGEYPGAKSENAAQEKISCLLDAGVTRFLDLTEAGEYNLNSYAAIAARVAGERGLIVAHQRLPIVDISVPTRRQMVCILYEIDRAMKRGEVIYVHCYGGIGRTGTVIGCWLVRHGLPGRQALAKIKTWRRGTPDGWRQSPETDEQWRMVMEWE